MVDCVHHIPGRARFKFEALRRNADLAQRLHTRVASVNGVSAVETNLHAASVTVYYCTQTAEMQEVFQHICDHCPKASINPPEISLIPEQSQTPSPSFASGPLRDAASKALVNTFIRRALEISLSSISVGSR